MKKIFALFLAALIFTLTATGCSNGSETVKPTDKTRNVDETTRIAENEFDIGETWTVDGQWSITVNSVVETNQRNEFYTDHTPAAVYIVSYTYTNVGYVDAGMDGLFFVMDETIVDSTGLMGYSYPGDVTDYAKEAPVGATCKAQVCIGVDNPGAFKLHVHLYDGTGTEQNAIFDVQP